MASAACRTEYNRTRPHSSLGNVTPEAFAALFKTDNPEVGLSLRLIKKKGGRSCRCSIHPLGSFSRRKDFQAGRPPPRLDRLHKRFYDPLSSHLVCETFMVVP